MWGLTLEGQELDDIKALLHNRFLNDNISVAHWLDGSGVTPGVWLEKDEQDFRELCRKHFAPKDALPING